MASIQRDGGDKIVKLAKALVVLTTQFAGLLKAKFPPPSPIASLIDAIIALGALLPAAEGQVFDFGGTNEDPLADPDNIPGINPSAPLPPELPE